MRVQEYEDEDDEDESSLWTRVRSLLLSLSLQLYHRLMKVRDELQRAVRTLGDAANAVSLRHPSAKSLHSHTHKQRAARCFPGHQNRPRRLTTGKTSPSEREEAAR